MTERHLPWRVMLLCAAGGSLDAVTVIAVGDAFASVMTGNIILLGVAAGSADLSAMLACVAAIGGYVVGGLVGSWWTGRRRREGEDPLWPARVTEALGIEAALLLAVAVTWALVADVAGTGATIGLLSLAAMAMGIQGAAVRAIGVTVATTYMTGAITGIAEAVAQRKPFSAQHRNGLYGLAALLVGALAGGLLVLSAERWAIFLPVTALVVVVLTAVLTHRRTARDRS